MATKKLGSSGMNDGMARKWGNVELLVNSALASCDVLDMGNVADALIQIPANCTALAFYSSDRPGGTFTVIQDNSGNAASLSVTGDDGQWAQFPTAVFACRYVKIVSTGANATVNVQGKS